jgi:hypothetical protein
MKTFKEHNYKPIFEAHEVEGLNEAEILEAEKVYAELKDYIQKNGIENLDEGILGSILGGVAGFVIGPAVGRVIANALGIQKGILYDMFTSRLVGAALGAAITKGLK